MGEPITWVALDTSKTKHAVAILNQESGELREMVVPNEPQAIRRFARRLVREASGEVRVCYEAGPCGYSLQRLLQAAAPTLSCEVIAPGLTPIRPGDRIKTDRRDARKLVKLFQAGELTFVHPPTEDEEAVRDLVRAREQLLGDLTRTRHRLSRFLLRRSVLYTNGYPWTQRHTLWLSTLRWDHAADEVLFQDARWGVTQLQDRLQALESQIEAFSQDARYREPVGWLRCFRGIDVLSAMTLLTELHAVERFSSPRALAAYLGLVPSEYSSGDRTTRGAITKKGNRHLRRVLIQIAWQYRFPPQVSPQLKGRRRDQPAWVRIHADRAMHRLYRRYLALSQRGKCRQQVVVAVARELVAFLWATLEEGRRRNPAHAQAA